MTQPCHYLEGRDKSLCSMGNAHMIILTKSRPLGAGGGGASSWSHAGTTSQQFYLHSERIGVNKVGISKASVYSIYFIILN